MYNINDTPRVVIAAAKGGAGKTIASLGITRALKRMGLGIAAFKKGPDYIDAGWLSLAAETPCYNLDTFLMTPETIKASFRARAKGKDVAIIEGNRGLYDGVDVEGTCSTAELAKLLRAPVVVVLDCTKMTRTAAALILGLKTLDPEVRIQGVILNHIVRARHENVVRRSIESSTGTPVLGVIPRMKRDPMPMRHLGVTPVAEHADRESSLDKIADIISENVDMERVLKIAQNAGPFPTLSQDVAKTALFKIQSITPEPNIGLIVDQAFQFYYPENIEALKANGAHLTFINAIKDQELPDVDLLYIGGGFPETQAERLAANKSFRASLKRAIEKGLPIYAECGGLMYLGRHLMFNGHTYPMVGAIGLDFVVEKRPQGHGYSVLELKRPTPFYEEGMMLRGHEFHYSRPVEVASAAIVFSCSVVRGHGIDGQEGVLYKNLFATYTHIHALQLKDWGLRLVRVASAYRRSKKMTVPRTSQARDDQIVKGC